ncbi:MAG TPA: aminotransferase class V-fold PLP-dependent enzyme, partial [Bacteroidota bacterium]
MRQVYLDHCATTPVDPRVVEAMIPYYSADYGNASSIHSYGRRARLALEESRERIAAFIGASGDELFFTSGGTESDNYAVFGVARAPEGNRNAKIITTAIEHHAVLDPVESLRSKGYRVSVLKVDHDALVDIGELEQELHDKVSLCSVVHANNEVGTIQPLKLIASMCRDRGVPVHTDAVQSVGKIPVNVRELGVDIVSMSAHKLYGPKGIGAI